MKYIIMAIIIIIIIAKVNEEDKKLKTMSDPNAEGYDNTRLTLVEKYNYEEIYPTGVRYYTSNIDKFMKNFPHPDWCTSNWIKTFIFQHFSFYCGQYVGKQKKEDENPLFYFKFLYLYPSFILFPFQKKRLFNHSRLSIYIINLISILFSKLLVIVMKSLYYSLFQLRLNNLELIMSFLQF